MEVAQTWFRKADMGDGVTLIWEPHAHPTTACNIWHIAGRDRDLLVDSGMGVMSLRGYLAGITDRPILALGTHSHFDHVGCHHEFPRRLMHTAEAAIMAAPSRDNMAIEGWVRADTFTALPHEGFEPESYMVKAAPVTDPVEEGDVIDLGDRVFRVLHLPGHSPGSIGVIEDATGRFFSGDAIFEGHLHDDVYHSVPEDFALTMARIRELPVTALHGGHGRSVERARMVEIANDYIAGRRERGCPVARRIPA